MKMVGRPIREPDDPRRILTEDDWLHRIRPRLSPGPNGCLEWSGNRDSRGYGGLRIRGIWWRAHRAVQAALRGPIPNGLLVMHTCDNPPCCNPDHLRLGTPAENSRDMVEKGRQADQPRTTHCSKGHRRTDVNTIIHKDGRRECRICRRKSARKYDRRVAAEKKVAQLTGSSGRSDRSKRGMVEP